MRLVSFLRDGRSSFGELVGDGVRDFGALAGPGSTLRDHLPLGVPALREMSAAVGSADEIGLREVVLLAPVPNARKYLGLGGNYASHMVEAERLGLRRGPGQVWFNKQVSCIHGPYAPVHRPWVSEEFDYEGELGVVIARDCRHVSADCAWPVVAGYVVCNDLSVRDWQMRSPTSTLGKSFDTHGPFGPWLTTADEIADPHALQLTVTVNGETRQTASTGEMMHKIPAMIEELTTVMTLQAGDVLCTGSPSGVGGLMDPPQFLKAGDRVRVEISGLGHIENEVVEEPRASAR